MRYTNRVSTDTLGKILHLISNYSINKSWLHENEKESSAGDNGLTSQNGANEVFKNAQE